jgi:hypothetical protein
VKRRDLLDKIKDAAKVNELDWGLAREGGNHEIWELDGKTVSIPRHKEINDVTAKSIMKHFEDKLGEGWFK